MSLGTAWTVDWVRASAAVIAEHRTELITLDRDIGDGDHGENMDRGFSAVLAKLDDVAADAIPADVLKLVATTLISTVGGAAGPLYGTAYLKAAGAVAGKSDLDGAALAALLRAAKDGIVLRGKAQPGDKTMIDAWAPAVDAADAAVGDGADAVTVLAAAAEAAESGATATEPLIARKGRASYLGERAIGHRDPGAQSTALLLRAAADVAASSGAAS
ncbi:dihydroxyacetone kinase-like protein [Mycetocola sp. CAN_C7]|uniref:dihydroxyacetone kinase subunit DhaL n=1 Tax=Mycetocola sp. CAN_C7 TaxID=2787724 RepID=UPI0018C9DF29